MIMKEREKYLIFRSYQRILNGNATEEEVLLWKLANAIHTARQNGDNSKEVLKDNDYTM